VSAPDVGERLEALLAEIGEQGGPQAAAIAEELVRMLVEYYGDGLARIVDLVGEQVARGLTADPQVESLLVLHGLHPLGVDERIEAALDRVRPYLGSHAGGVAYLGVDDHDVAHLRLDGSCNGCPSSTVTVRLTIEEAVLAAAPELAAIEVEGSVEDKPLLQIGMRPADGPVWRHPSARELPAAGTVSTVRLDGRRILLARLGDTYYAYADACAGCGGSFGSASLHGEVLTCPTCAARFDVRLAGMSADGSGRRLDPLPLLDDVSGVRVAVQAQLEDA
jgi:Fe-S cluster biogenesis protein NfuA/nitrite reductase/ring-hydroxylating ferredoxin subunit